MAQWLACRAHVPEVDGSIPSSTTIFFVIKSDILNIYMLKRVKRGLKKVKKCESKKKIEILFVRI